MEENLKINSKLYSFSGVIDRHDFFLNYIYTLIISMVAGIPYQLYLFRNLGSLSDIMNLSGLFFSAYPPVLVYEFLTVAGISVIFCSNICRRINDIRGSVSLGINILCSIIYCISVFSFLLITFKSALFFLAFIFINFVILLILFLKKGSITSKLPEDNNKKFNWGAFFGTWLWGLFNKSYIPLLMLLLWATPVGIAFGIICGLKGNEWAYNNRNAGDIEEFNKSQRRQAFIFGILCLIVFPVVLFVSMTAISAKYAGEIKNNPELSAKIKNNMEIMKNNIYSEYFVYHEILENENKFYVQPDKWNSYSFSDKTKLLEISADFSAEEKNKTAGAKDNNTVIIFTKSTELPKTKIYNAQNKQLLGEFIYPEAQPDNFIEMLKAGVNSYKFYNAS